MKITKHAWLSQAITCHRNEQDMSIFDIISSETLWKTARSKSYWVTLNMLADILTKALPRPQHERLRNQVMTDVLRYIGTDLLTQVSYCKDMLASLTLWTWNYTILHCYIILFTRCTDHTKYYLGQCPTDTGSPINCARPGGGFVRPWVQ